MEGARNNDEAEIIGFQSRKSFGHDRCQAVSWTVKSTPTMKSRTQKLGRFFNNFVGSKGFSPLAKQENFLWPEE